MLNKIKIAILAAILLAVTAIVGIGAYKYWDRGNQLEEANKTIVAHVQTIANLRAATNLQNSHVDEYESISDKLNRASKQGLAHAQKTVKQEERRISGIRSAPKAESYEEIRQKMIKDALL